MKRMQDFLGHEYGVGDLVIYGAMSGRCVNMVIGRCVEVYEVFQSPESYKWLKLKDGQAAPFEKRYGYFDPNDVLVDTDLARAMEEVDRSFLTWREYKTAGRIETYTRVKVQPLRGARWVQHSDKKYYVDSRTGKRINPDAPSGKHIKVPSHYAHADGTPFDYEANKEAYEGEARYRPRGYDHSYDTYFRRNYHVNHGKLGAIAHGWAAGGSDIKQLWYVSDEYNDYVEGRIEGPKPVTLEVTDNIVKWEGDLPEES